MKRERNLLARSAARLGRIAVLAAMTAAMVLAATVAAAADSTPTPTADRQYVGTSEVVSGRNADTRVWENRYQSPEVSMITGNPTGKMLEQKESYIEKGTNICYDAQEYSGNAQADSAEALDPAGAVMSTASAAPPQWEVTDIRIEPSQASGYAWQVVKGPVRAFFRGGIRGAEPNVRLDVRTGSAVETQLLGLTYYDPASGRSQVVDLPRDVAPEVRDNRLVYRGAFACGSLEYVYTRLGVRQDLVVENAAALPDPASLGFDPATCVLMVGTCVSTPSGSAAPAAAARVVDTKTGAVLSTDIRSADLADSAARRKQGPALALEFAPADPAAPRSVAFDAGLAYDASSPRALCSGDGVSSASRPSESAPTPESDLYKVIERINNRGDVNLFEGVSIDWLRQPQRAFPVRVDYDAITKSGTQSLMNETWIKGITYYVTSTYLVPNDHSLTIEPGTIVKVANNLGEGIHINWTGKLTCRGNPYDYTRFVPESTNIGTWVSSTAGSPTLYLNISGPSGMPPIEFTQFKSGYYAIVFYANSMSARSASDGPNIKNCVFRDQTGASIYADMLYVPGNGELSIFNCLFAYSISAQPYAAIHAKNLPASAQLLEVCNCTIAGDSFRDRPVLFQGYGSGNSLQYHIVDNIIVTTSTCCISASGAPTEVANGFIGNNVYAGSTFTNITSVTMGTNTSLGSYSKEFYSVNDDNFFSPALANGEFYPAGIELVGEGSVGGFMPRGMPKGIITPEPDYIMNRGRVFASYGSEVPNANVTSVTAASLGTLSVVRPIRVDSNANDPLFDIHGGTSSESALIDGTEEHLTIAKMADGGTTTDIGYHYPLVHGILQNGTVTFFRASNEGYRTFHLVPGTVVASSGASSCLKFDNDAGDGLKINAIGTPASPVRFTDYAAAGDNPTSAPAIFSPSSSSTYAYVDVDVTQMAADGIYFQYCIFEYGRGGLRLSGPTGQDYLSNLPRAQVLDCVFRYNGLWESYITGYPCGVLINHCDADVMNCLFRYNRYGVGVATYLSNGCRTQYQPNIIGCTFDQGVNGVLIMPGFRMEWGGYTDTAYDDHTYGLIEDNVFANLYGQGDTTTETAAAGIRVWQLNGMGAADAAKHFTGIVRRNMFWNTPVCVKSPELNIASYALYGAGEATNYPDADTVASASCPCLVNYSTRAGTTWRDDEAASAQCFLAKTSGDASREPLVTGLVDSVTPEFGGYQPYVQIFVLGKPGFVGGQYGIPTPDIPSSVTQKFSWSYAGQPGSTQSVTTLTYTLLAVGQNSGTTGTTNNSMYVTIGFRSDATTSGLWSRVKCHLPTSISVPNGQYLLFWVAQDGSLYWAHTSHGATSINTTANQNVFYALRGGSSELARAWCDESAATQSPAIDTGTPDYLSGGWTSADDLYDCLRGAAGLETADNILPYEYRLGYVRRPEWGYSGENPDPDQDDELPPAKKLDLGYHYWGQQQHNAPKSDNVTTGSSTLHPPIRLTPEPPKVSLEEGEVAIPPNLVPPQGKDMLPLRYNAVSYAPGGPGSGSSQWLTGTDVFAVRWTLIGQYYGGGQLRYGFWLPSLHVYNVDGGVWQTILDHADLGIYHQDCLERAYITSFNTLAVPADRTGAGNRYAAASVAWLMQEPEPSGYFEPTSQSVTLAYRSDGQTQWSKTSCIYRTWTQNESGGINGGVGTYWCPIAVCDGRDGYAHIFLLEWSGDTDTPLSHRMYMRHGVQTTTQPLTIGGWLDTENGYIKSHTDMAQPRAISATFDDTYQDDSHKVRAIRLVWPQWKEESGDVSCAKVGRYYPLDGSMDRFYDLDSGTTDGLSSHNVNSIDYADFNSDTSPAWLKSRNLMMTSFVASEAVGRDPDTHRCTFTTSSQTDSWDARQGAVSLLREPTVAARALRVPRYAGLQSVNDPPDNAAVATDGLVTLQKGGPPVVKTNTNNFLDQYLVSAVRPNTATSSETMSVTRLRP